jgi:hypothetical protein
MSKEESKIRLTSLMAAWQMWSSRPPEDQKIEGLNPAEVYGVRRLFVHCNAAVRNLFELL